MTTLFAYRTRSLMLAATLVLGGATASMAQAPPEVVPPQPTVPEMFTLTGQYVRVAYNNVGFVTLGYKVAQGSIGEDWMLLETGVTVRKPTKDHTLTRASFSLKTPDGTVIPLATQSDYAKAGHLRAVNNRAKVVRDSINYFPADVSRACPLQFFADPTGANRLSYDEVEVNPSRACVGRIFFKVPGGIKTGQHWLLVNYGDSEVQVPFRILTAEEAKTFEDTWQDLKKAHDASYTE